MLDPKQRLQEIEENLNILYGRRNALEKGAMTSPDDDKVFQNEEKIRRELRPKIQKFEEEYFQTLQQLVPEVMFVESEAQSAIDVITQEVAMVRLQPELPVEILAVLERIEEKLNEPGPTADAKLKGTLSMFPPFIGLSYEAQLDTENFCRKYFPTFTRLVKGAAKKP